MPRRFDSFLTQTTVISRTAPLGRVVNVTQETWRLADDPQTVAPHAETLATGHTASEAADLARSAAMALPRHGFHKPSGAWWGADDTRFHRFVVHAGRRRRAAGVVVASGLVGLALAALLSRRRARRRPPGQA
ncbi:MAG TPA: hypothetical protein VF474_07845 [Phenylobacterium sp.]